LNVQSVMGVLMMVGIFGVQLVLLVEFRQPAAATPA